MTAKHKQSAFAIVIAATFVGAAANCHAQCATCATPTVAYYQPTTAYYQPTTAYYQPTTAYYQPTTAYYQPTTAYYQPTTAYFQPAAYTAYSPVVTTASTGWYPGYWLDRFRARRAAPVVAAYPTYTAAYAPATYAASYAPATHTAAYAAAPACSSCSTSASYAPSCSTCTTCAMPATVQEVVMRPVCDPCSACSGCSSCAGGSTVTQAVYDSTAPCTNCAPSTTHSDAPIAAPPADTIYHQNSQQPTLDPNSAMPGERTFRQSDKLSPPPEPASDELDNHTPSSQDSSTHIEAPRLFNPNDRTAQRQIGPVHTAVYHKPVAKTSTTTRTATWQLPQHDADGWTSASK